LLKSNRPLPEGEDVAADAADLGATGSTGFAEIAGITRVAAASMASSSFDFARANSGSTAAPRESLHS
jgi:hypothetical protein